jgi:triosephosphate isomerase (TIM)
MQKLIVANWKMNPASLEEAKDIFENIKKGVEGTNAEVVICPPFVYLSVLSGLTLGAQNCFWEEKGTYTGDISPAMLKDLGVKYVIVGHSERRKNFGETDEQINKKLKAVLEIGLTPILCIGENAEEKQKAETESVLKRQLIVALNGIPVPAIDNFIIAYEPVWAISTGDPYKTKELPTAEIVKNTQDYIRSLLVQLFNEDCTKNTRIIYGGSANAGNAKDYLGNAKIQGFLVGGASLKPEDFIQIVKVAE